MFLRALYMNWRGIKRPDNTFGSLNRKVETSRNADGNKGEGSIDAIAAILRISASGAYYMKVL